MDEITKQIEALAETMEKSTQTPTEKLHSVIKSLGAKGLKDKLATLSEDDKLFLKATLEEMTLKKAISFDKEAQAVKFVQGNIKDTIIQEDKADDDADEKLMKPAAAKMDHQGTPTEGWSGQVIKSIEDSEEQLETLITKAMDKCGDEKMVMKKLKDKGMDEKKVQGALDKYKEKKMKKSEADEIEKAKKMSKDEAKDKIMSMEEKEHGTKDPKKLVDAEKKEHKMKKSDEEIEKAKMNKEEDQLGDAPDLKGGKQAAKKSPAPDIEDNAKANKKNMTKSLTWDEDNRLFKSNALGRNHSFNMDKFIDETIANEPKVEDVKKSEDKEDINDLIAKSEDKSLNQVNREREASEVKTNGTLVKSFADEDLANVLGITVEEAKKILG